MNKWTKESIAIANRAGYLDRLSEIYVMNVNPERPIDQERVKQIKSAFKRKDTRSLIHFLIENEVFPIKDSYVGFFRVNPKAIDINPKTVKRIGERLYRMGVENLLKESSRPKETNRQLGHSFKKSLEKLYPALPPAEFEKAKGVAILKGSDATLAKYARENFGSHLTKGIDFVLKKGNQYVIGEAKFLTTPGGEQNGSFEDASKFISGAHEHIKNVKRVALLDGYIWLKSNGGLHHKIVNTDLDIFSALLLPKFVKSLPKL